MPYGKAWSAPAFHTIGLLHRPGKSLIQRQSNTRTLEFRCPMQVAGAQVFAFHVPPVIWCSPSKKWWHMGPNPAVQGTLRDKAAQRP